MRNLLALLLFVPSLCFAQSVTLPYNPDVNADSAIGAPDLLDFLPLFGGNFTPDPILVDGQTLEQYIENLESALANSESDTVALPMLPGTEPGQMLYWDGSHWSLLPAGSAGEFLGTNGATPFWQELPVGNSILEVGCADQTACNYNPTITVNYAALCVYEDECGVCDGPGAIYQCGCADLPEGDCDCDGNQLDALNVCGGTCAADVDGDGICDDGDDCIGEADECGVCNGPGAIYECGCTGIAPDECDCAGTPDVDQDGICDTEDPCIGVADSDSDGICDDVDDCDGTLDLCGVCNGPGPIYECGCADIPEGDCDCAGNEPDLEGNCQDYASDTDDDGLYDTLLDPCLNQTLYSFDGHEYELVAIGDRCWFRENLRATHYANGDAIEYIADTEDWSQASGGAWCEYELDSAFVAVYGLLYNWQAVDDQRNICPTGWSIPSEDEWSALLDSLGGPATAAGPMKEAGQSHWSAPNSGATNASGLTVLPGGERGFATTGFRNLGTAAYLWSSTYAGTGGATSLRVNHDTEVVTISANGIERGQSIRCIRKPPVFGCTDPNFSEYDYSATVNDGSCSTPGMPGCTDANYAEYDAAATVDDGSCATMMGCDDGSSLTYAEHEYPLIKIGDQCWFAENLRSETYRNGEEIPNIQDPLEWLALPGSTNPGAWCDYDNSLTNGELYGHLYNLYAVNDDRRLCPTGWRVPKDSDWKEMETHLGMPASQLDLEGFRGVNQQLGPKLRSAPSDTPPWSGNNETGFSGLPGGYRQPDAVFRNWGDYGNWGIWAAASDGEGNFQRSLRFSLDGFARGNDSNQNSAFSVRCLRGHEGCTDSGACNFNPAADENDGSCIYPTVWHIDADGDGLGGAETLLECGQPAGYVLNSSDACDDTTASNFLSASNDPCTFPFWTCGDPITYWDYDYATVLIGDQCWFSENLRTISYSNGDGILHAQPSDTWTNANTQSQGAYCFYGAETTSPPTSGALYNAHAISDSRGICPIGWKVPSDADLMTLETSSGMPDDQLNASNWRGVDEQVGSALKDDSTWDGNNSTGFTALPSGYRNAEGEFWNAQNCYLWSNSNYGYDYKLVRHFAQGNPGIWRSAFPVERGFSARCIKD